MLLPHVEIWLSSPLEGVRGADMVDQLSWSTVGEWLAGFAPEGPLRTAVLLVYGLCIAIAPIIYKYYLGVLAQGAQPEGSEERKDYDKLRASLAGDNLAARLYADWLTRFLDAVDRFFGDAGAEGQHAFGLKKPAPLWTAPAFDRCLLLALAYPIATIFVIWAISGHIGPTPAEAALGLQPDRPCWRRAFAVMMAVFGCFSIWRAVRMDGWKSVVWSGVVGASAAASLLVTGQAVLVTAFFGGLLGAFGFTGIGAFARACAGVFVYLFVTVFYVLLLLSGFFTVLIADADLGAPLDLVARFRDVVGVNSLSVITLLSLSCFVCCYSRFRYGSPFPRFRFRYVAITRNVY